MITEGYDRPDIAFTNSTGDLLAGNQLQVEHRYFGKKACQIVWIINTLPWNRLLVICMPSISFQEVVCQGLG